MKIPFADLNARFRLATREERESKLVTRKEVHRSFVRFLLRLGLDKGLRVIVEAHEDGTQRLLAVYVQQVVDKLDQVHERPFVVVDGKQVADELAKRLVDWFWQRDSFGARTRAG